MGRTIAILSWAHALALLTALATVRWGAESHWLSALVLMMPRWAVLVPLPFLMIVAGFRRRLDVLTLQAAIGIVALGPWLGLCLARQADPSPGSETIRVLSFNCSSIEIDGQGVVDLIRAQDADVVLLQESYANPVLNRYFELNGWHQDVSKSIASRWPILDGGRLLPDEVGGPDFYSAWGWKVRVRTPQGREAVLVSVHMPTLRTMVQHLGRGDFRGAGAFLRWDARQFRRVREALAVEGDVPLVIAGDFNLPSDSHGLRSLQRRYRSAFDQAGWGYGYTRPSALPWVRIDHILASRHWSIARSWVGPDLDSDHLPILAELRLRPDVPSPVGR